MTDRMLIKGGIVLTPGPGARRAGRRRRPGRGRQDRGRRPEPVRRRRADHRRDRRHRHPGLHRHPPPHVGDVDPDLRAGLRADHLLRLDPRQVRAALPARRRLRRQPVGLARVHQRGHHDAGRLVAHHEHARPRRRGDPRPPGLEDPVRLRLRLREHVARRLVVRPGLHGQRPDLGRRRMRGGSGSSTSTPTTAGSRWRSRPAAPTSASPTSSATTGSWPRSSGLNITVHVAMDRFGYTKMQITALRDMDLLYPNTTYVHASHFTDEEWALARDSGGNVSFAPQIEVQMGHGWAPAVTALEYDLPIGLSSDVATTAPSDQFTQMRSIFGSERGRKHQEAWDANLDGLEASPGLITSRQVLVVGDDRRGRGRRHRRPDRLADPGQAGRHRHHRRVGRERGADHRPGRGGRLRRGRLERQDGHRRRRDAQGGLPAEGLARRAAQGRRRRRATTCSRSSASPEPGWIVKATA